MRKLQGVQGRIVYVYVLLMGLFHLYTAAAGNFEAYLQRTLHLTWVLPLAFILFPATSRSPKDRVPVYDWIIALVSTIPGIYGILNYTMITERIQQVDPLTTLQIVLGTMLVVFLLEATRRIVGIPLAMIALLSILYMIFGHKMSGIMQGYEFSFAEIIEHLYLTDEGIYSMPLGVSATFVMIFLIFGGFLEKSGAGGWFMDVAQAFTGQAPGGPAQIAVLSSCLFGSISGSAVANVYSTGTFTIPLMKKIGYQPYFAGAVEAVASSGGQLMPPVMGAGAFLMASFLGMQYKEVMIAAIFPAILYYGAVFLMVRLRALKMGLKGLSKEDLPSKKAVLSKLYMLLPIAGLVYLLLVGYTPMRAALVGIYLAWFVSFFSFECIQKTGDAAEKAKTAAKVVALLSVCITGGLIAFPSLLASMSGTVSFFIFGGYLLLASRFNPGMNTRDVLDAIESGSRGIPLVCVACATAGIVLGAVSLTGIGGKLVGFVIAFAGDSRLLALVLVMIVSTLLGMGLPTTGAYILAAALGAPILVKLGFIPLAAHLFVFYYAIMSNITPPVALAAYAASSIAGAHPNKTGFQAMQLGFLAFVVPFAFCYDPGLLMQGDFSQNAWAVLSGFTSMFAFAYMWMGYISKPIPAWMRLLLGAAGLACLTPYPSYIAGGLVVTIAAFVYCKYMPVKNQIAS